MEKIFQVTDVTTALLKSNPPKLMVMCKGIANSTGWEKVILTKVEYVIPPEDGIQDFHIIGNPPKNNALNIFTPVTAETLVGPIPNWLKGVRIHAENNSLTEYLNLYIYGGIKYEHLNEGEYLIESDFTDKISNEVEEIGFFAESYEIKSSLSSSRCIENTLLKTPINVETKVTGKFPRYKFYRRTVYSEIILEVCIPSDVSSYVESSINECIKVGVAATAVIIAGGGIPIALATFKKAFTACLITKGVDMISSISMDIKTTTSKGEWRRI